MKPVEFLRRAWRLLKRATNSNHDPLLVFNMTCFNFGGGWKELLLKVSPQNI